jgi:DNA-binding GntR family transcriptional regulator
MTPPSARLPSVGARRSPTGVARSIRQDRLRRESVLTVLDRVGPRMVKADHSMTAIAADATAARELRVALGTPLLRMRASLRDSKGQVRAVYEGLCRPDRLKVRAELERDFAAKPRIQWRLKR